MPYSADSAHVSTQFTDWLVTEPLRQAQRECKRQIEQCEEMLRLYETQKTFLPAEPTAEAWMRRAKLLTDLLGHIQSLVSDNTVSG